MPDHPISELMLTSSGLQNDEFAIETGGLSKKITLSQIANFTNVSGILKTLTGDANATSITAMVRVSGMDVTGVDAGNYFFEYYIRAQFAANTQSIKFAVNHTGTTTSFMYDMFHPGNSNTQAGATLDQENNATTGRVWCFNATRTKNATLGPQTANDTANSDILLRISGMMIVTVTGTLELYVGCESAGINLTIMAGTSLILKKVG